MTLYVRLGHYQSFGLLRHISTTKGGRVYTFNPPFRKKIFTSTSTHTPTSKNSHSPPIFHIYTLLDLYTPFTSPFLPSPISTLNIPAHPVNSKIIHTKFNTTHFQPQTHQSNPYNPTTTHDNSSLPLTPQYI